MIPEELNKIDIYSPDFDVNTQDSNGNTQLHLAIKKRDISLVQSLLKCSNIDINKTNLKSQTPLIIATKIQDIEIIKLLIYHGCDINVKDEKGYTALMHLAKIKNFEAIKVLSSHDNFSINATNKYGLTLLHEAAKSNNLAILVELVDRGANIDALDRWDNTPLMYAILHRNYDSFMYLIKKGCKINISNIGGRTALHTAAQYYLIEFADQLLRHGALPNIIDSEKFSPALIAAKYQCEEILQMLINANCNVLNLDSSGKNIFHYACLSGYTKVVNQILTPKYNIDVELKDGKGNDPLFLAVLRNQVDVVKILLKYNCNPNQEACFIEKKTNCLSHALREGFVEICLYLIEAGSKFNDLKYQLDVLDVHASIAEDRYFICSLKKLASNVPQLQILCRNKIRRSIGQNILQKLEHIYLPPRLKNILTIPALDFPNN